MTRARTFLLAAAVAAAALAGGGGGAAAAPAERAADCRFDDARSYGAYSRIRLFTTSAGLFDCLTDVGRAYRLDTGTLRAHATATRRAVFGAGDWVGYPVRDRQGRRRVRTTNLRSGRSHGTDAGAAVPALVVNFDGTLAWIAGERLRTKPAGSAAATLASDAAIDRRFLGIELEGCAVTWRSAGEQRSSSIHCKSP